MLPTELEPLIKITLNRQTTEGQNFTVDGLVVELGGEEVAVLASTTCGEAPPGSGEAERRRGPDRARSRSSAGQRPRDRLI